jgi:DNA-binding transcriptional regulator LsrR (DeoR family)
VLRLKYFEDMTDREIADQLDLTPGRVGQIIKKAHRVLRLKDTKIGDHTTSGALRESLTAFEGARNGRM